MDVKFRQKKISSPISLSQVTAVRKLTEKNQPHSQVQVTDREVDQVTLSSFNKGNLEHPKSRKVSAKKISPRINPSEARAIRELAETRQQLESVYYQNQELQYENQVLRLAWDTAHCMVLSSRVKEAVMFGELQNKKEELRNAHAEQRKKESKIRHEYSEKIKALKNQIEIQKKKLNDSECRMNLFIKMSLTWTSTEQLDPCIDKIDP